MLIQEIQDLLDICVQALFSSSTAFLRVSGNRFNNVGQFGFCCTEEWQGVMQTVTVVLVFASSLLISAKTSPCVTGIWKGPKEKILGLNFSACWRDLPVSCWLLCCAAVGAGGGKPVVWRGMKLLFLSHGCRVLLRDQSATLQAGQVACAAEAVWGRSGDGGTVGWSGEFGWAGGVCHGGAEEGPGPPLRRPPLPSPARLERERQEFAPSQLRLQAPTEAGKRGSGLFIAYRFLGPFITWSSPGS